MGLRFGLLRDVKELLYSGFTLTRMDLFDRKLVTEDSMLSFTFNSRRELTIVVLQIRKLSRCRGIRRLSMLNNISGGTMMSETMLVWIQKFL